MDKLPSEILYLIFGDLDIHSLKNLADTGNSTISAVALDIVHKRAHFVEGDIPLYFRASVGHFLNPNSPITPEIKREYFHRYYYNYNGKAVSIIKPRTQDGTYTLYYYNNAGDVGTYIQEKYNRTSLLSIEYFKGYSHYREDGPALIEYYENGKEKRTAYYKETPNGMTASIETFYNPDGSILDEKIFEPNQFKQKSYEYKPSRYSRHSRYFQRNKPLQY